MLGTGAEERGKERRSGEWEASRGCGAVGWQKGYLLECSFLASVKQEVLALICPPSVRIGGLPFQLCSPTPPADTVPRPPGWALPLTHVRYPGSCYHIREMAEPGLEPQLARSLPHQPLWTPLCLLYARHWPLPSGGALP